MQVIIMAAGLGSRLNEKTEEIPKALISVNGKRLIDYSIDFVNSNIVEKIYVVGGYYFKKLQTHLENKKIEKLTLLNNKEYKKGNIITLKTALGFIDDDFLLMNVDHIYPKKLFNIISKNIYGINGVCDFGRELFDDDMKVKLNSDKKIKKISKILKDFDCGYIGMTTVQKDYLPSYVKSVDEVIKRDGEKSNVESVLGYLAEKNRNPGIINAGKIKWLEIDNQQDLDKAESLLKNDFDLS